MATLTILTPVSTAGTLLGAAACAAGGDQMLNDGRTILYFKNTDVGTVTITAVTSSTVAGLAIADVAFTLIQNAERVIGPFEPRYWNDASGYVLLTYSAVTALTVAAIRVTG